MGNQPGAGARRRIAAKSPSPPASSAVPANRWTVPGICVCLAAISLAVFGQTFRHEFVNFDDDGYVYENALVSRGLEVKGIEWAFTHSLKANWHPLTVISHMLDCQLYGLHAGGHHLTNVFLHTAAVILLFLVLREMSGALWRSAFVAAVFAIHPLRVESVAWVAERKDVLSGVFFMLTLWAYVRYVRRPFSILRYLWVAFLFTLGLMSKPMLVTLPFVLLLLDYWPLRRFAESPGGKKVSSIRRALIVEKIPLLLLSAAGCVTALLAQKHALVSVREVSLPLRVGNAMVSCVAYLGQMVYPAGLGAFYPFPWHGLPLHEVALSLVLLASLSAAVLFWRRGRPYLVVGWLWYLGMLVPVLGLVQAGAQSRADRYTYLPQIGVCLMVAWLSADLFAGWRQRRLWLGGIGALVIVVLIVRARTQTGYWHDSESLWNHTLAVTEENDVANNNLANVLLQKGQTDEAIARYRKAMEIRPDYVDAHNGLGFALLQKGEVDEAMGQFREALNTQPAAAGVHNNFGMALLQVGRVDEAIIHFQKALETDPDLADTHNNLGVALLRRGQVEAAIAHYQRALEIKPDYAGADNNLAWVLATFPEASVRKGARAVELAQQADRLSGGGSLVILRTLAAAYAEAGRFSDAIETAGRALQLAKAQSNRAWADALQSEIRLYQAGLPLRDPAQAP
jgi:tetratricopeptide (TPR) repeat protein